MLQLGKKGRVDRKGGQDRWIGRTNTTAGQDSTDGQNICIEHIKWTDRQERRKRTKNRKEGQEKRTRQDTLTCCTKRTNIHNRQADDL